MNSKKLKDDDKKIGTKRKIISAFAVGIISFILIASLFLTHVLDPLENIFWDLRVKTFAQPGKATDDIRMILIDQTSLDWAKTENGLGWPWPRELYSVIISYCQQQGAKGIIFDMLFTEPSLYGTADDEIFANAATQSGITTCAIFLSNEGTGSEIWPDYIKNPLQSVTAGALRKVPDASRILTSIPEIAGVCSGSGNVMILSDTDGIYRRVPVIQTFKRTQPVPALGIAALFMHTQNTAVSTTRYTLTIDGRHIPIDEKGCSILNYRGPAMTYNSINAAAVIRSSILEQSGEKSELASDFFKDKYVFIGTSAPGLYDLKPSPLSAQFPGVEIQATALDNFISDDFIREPRIINVCIYLLLLCIATAVFIRLTKKASLQISFILLFAFIPLCFSWLFYRTGIWLPAAAPLLGAIFSIVGSMMINYFSEGRQKKFIKTAFSQYLSPVIIDQLIQNPETLKLGGEKKALSIFFSDIRGFTAISEKLSPENLTAFLHDYLTAMTDIIYGCGGTIDKYEGDAIIAFWNAPLEDPDHALKAVKAAVLCRKKTNELRPILKEKYGHEIFVRTGINTGEVVIGNMGSLQRFNYTFLGDAGNLASRLEGINKQFGTDILISGYTKEACNNLEGVYFREISRVTVVGRQEPVTVYEPISIEEYNSKKQIFAIYHKALEFFYNKEPAKALELYSEIKHSDNAAACSVKKCEELLLESAESWNGIWEIKEK